MSVRPHLAVLALAVAFLSPAPDAAAGDIVKRSFTGADGKKVTGYVYRSNKSRTSYRGATYRHRGHTTRYYPAFRSYGRASGGVHRTSRPAVRTTRTEVTHRAARPVSVGASRQRGRVAGLTVFRSGR